MKKLIRNNKNSLTSVIDHEPVADSRLIAEHMTIEHRPFYRQILKHESRLEGFGQVRFENALGKRQQGGGLKEKYALLNESHCIFMLTISRNTERVMDLKERLTAEFEFYRKRERRLANAKARQAELSWQETRASTKIARRLLTDQIQIFIEYAKSQGSRNHKWYDKLFTNIAYYSLFEIEFEIKSFDKFRNLLSHEQLTNLSTAENLERKTIYGCIKQVVPYKEIYPKVKTSIENFVTVVGKSAVLDCDLNDELPLLIEA